jgi:hypothetical protein
VSKLAPIGFDADTCTTAELERVLFAKARVLMRANPGRSAEELAQLMLDRAGTLPPGKDFDVWRYAAHQSFLHAARHVLAEH